MKLFRRDEPSVEERSGTFSLRQLAIAFGVDPSSPTVGSIDEAIRNAATWACVKIKAQGCAMLPVSEVYYRGQRRVVVPTPSPIIRNPSALVSARTWRFQVFVSMFTDGNAFGLVTATDGLRPTQIELLAPEQVTQRKVVDGVPQVNVGDVTHRLYPFGDLWHLPGEMVMPGSPFGLSPIGYGARATGTALAAERFGGRFFSEGGHPTGVLTVPGEPTEEQSTALKHRLMSVLQGSREPLVVPQGTTYERLQVDPKDSQFIDLLRFEVEQECRRHGVPPSMVFGAVSGKSITYTNATQADLAYLKHTLSYPIDLFEDAIDAMTPSPRSCFLDRDAILEGDPEMRVDLQVKRVQNHLRSVNEVRAEDHLDPFGPEYDSPGIPAPMPAEAPGVAEEPRAVELLAEVRSMAQNATQRTAGDTHIHLPDSLQVEMRQEPIVVPAPVVNVPPAEVTVNVPPAEVTVNVEPTPVSIEAPNVSVDAPSVTVQPAPVTVVESGRRSVRFKRDKDGKITAAEVD